MVLSLLWYPVRQQNESNEENTKTDDWIDWIKPLAQDWAQTYTNLGLVYRECGK